MHKDRWEDQITGFYREERTDRCCGEDFVDRERGSVIFLAGECVSHALERGQRIFQRFTITAISVMFYARSYRCFDLATIKGRVDEHRAFASGWQRRLQNPRQIGLLLKHQFDNSDEFGFLALLKLLFTVVVLFGH